METAIYVGIIWRLLWGSIPPASLSSSIVKEDPKFSVLENPLLRDTIIFGGLGTLVSCSEVFVEALWGLGSYCGCGQHVWEPFLGRSSVDGGSKVGI